MTHFVYSQPIKAIIFDNDGTLMDTEGVYTDMHQYMTGQPLTWDFKLKLMGSNPTELARKTINHCNLNYSIPDFITKMRSYLDSRWPEVQMLPGAEDVIDKFYSMHIPMSIATSSSREEFLLKSSTHHNVTNVMDHIICGTDVARGKPNPDLFLKAFNLWDCKYHIQPCNTLVFEDAPNGVKAANNAGMPVVYVPDPHVNAQQALRDAGATATLILDSLESFNFNSFKFELPQGFY